jgi:hypothetical protein
MSERDLRIEIAWSALTASTGLNPASYTMSIARMCRIISSSTIRTPGAGVKSVATDASLAVLAADHRSALGGVAKFCQRQTQQSLGHLSDRRAYDMTIAAPFEDT